QPDGSRRRAGAPGAQSASGSLGGARRRGQRRGVPRLRPGPLHHRHPARCRRRPDPEDHMSARLRGKVALITGAARGSGRAQAVRFAQEGADIVALDVCGPIETVAIPPSTPADLDRTAALVTGLGARVHTESVDVRDLAGVRAATDRAAERFGGLDVVCATAGITSRGAAVGLDENTSRALLGANLTGGGPTLPDP